MTTEGEAGTGGTTAPPVIRHAKWIIMATVFGVMMDAIDVTALAVANPVIAVELDTTLPSLQWVTVAYVVTQAALLIIAGKFSDTFGHKRVFLIGLVGFALASAVAGLSVSVEMMIAARIAQGVFGSVLFPSSLAILRVMFPPEQLKKAVAVWGGALALAGAAGPLIAGVLVTYLGWRWVFFVNLLIAAVAVFIVVSLVPALRPSAENRDRDLDLPGVALLAVALASLVWAVIRIPVDGWASGTVLGAFAIAVVFLAGFLVRESRTARPLLPLGLFRNRPLSASATVLVFSTLTMTGTMFYISLYLQQVHRFSPLQAGITLLPVLALFSVGAPIGANLNQKFGPKVPIIGGMVVIAGSLFGLSLVEVDSSVHTIWPFLAPLGLAIGAVNPTATVVVLSAAPMRLAGVASGLQQTAGMLGSALGTSVLGVVLSAKLGSVLSGRLDAAQVPPEVADPIEGAVGDVAQGVVPLPSGLPAEQADAAVRAAHQAFVDGLQAAMITAAVIALVTAVFAAIAVQAPEPPAEDTPTPTENQPAEDHAAAEGKRVSD